ncbi:peptidase M20, dimerization domain-containing protein [Cercophora samala]|uniref:Peptidase M20, dimerization domain-containing protein n=1 Tax=Cercophora samala TaxID=330535 RepID=A0AA40DAH8_9PEZI|nr:peptidase M20, dimerization domain-containing protein [Cercophora samala]
MIKDGLYQAIGPGQPDIILTQHITNHKAGTIQIGYDHVLAGKKAFFITIHGVGGHASKPHLCIDPVVIACSIVLKLQTIISRAVDPHDAAVVTCTSVATGREPNAIQDKAEITVDIRAFTTHTLNHVVKAMERVVKAECDDCEVAPTIVEFDNIPPLENDANATQAIEDQFRAYYGDEVVQQLGPNMASDDDLPLLAPEGVPCSYWTIRSTDPELWDKYNEEGRLNELPNVGDASFAPGEGREDTLRTGIDSLAMAALTFLDTRPNKDQN